MKHNKESFWIPYADLMTVLMVIFLFIAMAYMGLLQEKVGQVENVKQQIYTDLKQEFQQEATKWNLEINKDLSIRFKNADGLFSFGSGTPSPKFTRILNQFIPRYLAIVSQEKYRSNIQEVRVEGHTADDDYQHSIELSQQRANSVLFYLTSHPYFRSLQSEKQKNLRYLLTTSGYGWSRALDANGEFSSKTKKEFDIQSRRVEFRIVTNSDQVINELSKIKLN